LETARETLAHSLRVRFGTSSSEPNEHQLDAIIGDIQEIRRAGRHPSEADWRASVHRHCPSAGTHKYAGVDTSDLVALLQQATEKVQRD